MKQSYLHESAEFSENRNAKKRKKSNDESFGWNVFNEDTLYRAYDKRCKQIKQKGNQNQSILHLFFVFVCANKNMTHTIQRNC